jgi:hypothetical protein
MLWGSVAWPRLARTRCLGGAGALPPDPACGCAPPPGAPPPPAPKVGLGMGAVCCCDKREERRLEMGKESDTVG